ncbi:MAG: Clp protease ClpP [Synergistaceae bacterium]|nr:Clp protease ClpP [Synergistaceae bacterium]
MNKFWNFTEENGGKVLRLEGPVGEYLFSESIIPKELREELAACNGDLTVWINSPGGDVFAAAEIYTMLKDYKGKITVKIDALAASAASVIAMAGDKVLMSPVAMMMIHNPSTMAYGNAQDFKQAIKTLNEVKESLINAYAEKTGLEREKISELMNAETWLSAHKALELRFIDGILFSENESGEVNEPETENKYKSLWQEYTKAFMQSIFSNRSIPAAGSTAKSDTELSKSTKKDFCLALDGKTSDGAVPFDLLMKQLEFLR